MRLYLHSLDVIIYIGRTFNFMGHLSRLLVSGRRDENLMGKILTMKSWALVNDIHRRSAAKLRKARFDSIN